MIKKRFGRAFGCLSFLLVMALCSVQLLCSAAEYKQYEIKKNYNFSYDLKFTSEDIKILEELHKRHNSFYFDLGRIMDLTEQLEWLPTNSIVFERTVNFINAHTPLDQLLRLRKYVDSEKLEFYILAKKVELGKLDLSDPKRLKKFRKLWESNDFRLDDEAHFFGKFAQNLEFINQKRKIERNLLSENLKRAGYLVARYKGASAPLQRFRIRVAQDPNSYDSTILKSSNKYKEDEIVNFFYIKHLYKKNKNEEAFKRLLSIEPSVHTDKWWKIYHRGAREAIDKKKYDLAVKIASKVDITGSIDYEEQQWFIGWVKLRFLNKPQEAVKHLLDAYENALYATSKSRAVYWLAKAYETLRNKESYEKWSKVAKTYNSRFYGQMLCNSSDININKTQMNLKDLDDFDSITLEDQKFLDGFKYYMNKGDYRGSYRFMSMVMDCFIDKYSADSIASYYLKDQILFPGVILNKHHTNRGKKIKDYGYPVLEFNSSDRFKIIYHAIIRQESEFNYIAKSPVGAYGLMQLMPGTAKHVARKIKADHLDHMVYPRSNIKFGIYRFDEMMDKYNSLVLSICAYNAGPGNVNKWIKRYGDFRKLSTLEERLDWIEHIPFRETRGYVKKVLENAFIYSKIIGYKIDNIDSLIY